MKKKSVKSWQLNADKAVRDARADLALGAYGNALTLLDKAVRMAPSSSRIRHLLGETQMRLGQVDEALANLEMAVAANGNNEEYREALGLALASKGRVDEAIAHLQSARALGSHHEMVFNELSVLLLRQRRGQEALEVCDQGLAVCQDHFALLGNRCAALRRLGQNEDALRCCYRQRDMQPDDARVWYNMGNCLCDLGHLDEAIKAFRQACALKPDYALAHFALATALLLAGNFQDGFREYEWRWQSVITKEQRHFSQPLWDGSPLAGKRILIHREQGAGDVIQFVRYLPLVERLGGRITLSVRPPLLRLMSWLPGTRKVEIADSETPDFDVHCPLMSLPLLLGTDLNSIPPPASFEIPPHEIAPWAARISSGKVKVGLVWKGNPAHENDQNRSLTLTAFRPLLEVEGISFFSVQVGSAAEDFQENDLGNRVHDLQPWLKDYGDTAAALSCIDLLITVDTSVAHLAASLGKPVWMLVPCNPDWRWLTQRSDSPWYPTSMRLFRQKEFGKWEPVVQEILLEMQSLTPVSAASAVVERGGKKFEQPVALNSGMATVFQLAADFVPAGSILMDLGCGGMEFEQQLPYGCRYIPCDRVRRDDRTVICNFDEESVPVQPGTTLLTVLGLLESVRDWRGFLKQLLTWKLPLIFSCHPLEAATETGRDTQSGANQVSLDEVCSEVGSAGFVVQQSVRSGDQVILRIQPGQRRSYEASRILVLTYNNCGNFGDRLGFHLANSVLPAVAEIHYANFRPWKAPEGKFDLVVVGAGNSIYDPILTDDLVSLVRETPRSVGIFGTQYREEINQTRLSNLLDSLTVWFARSEEDMLLYGRGRANAIHLGDWLIDAFPMTRWTKNETVHIRREIWNDLPLDRTIQEIQRYRNVFSERIHPFLCALTSAERVSYSEQRESGSGRNSGKFHGMMLDIFGRTWPESYMFEFRRECVEDYRAKVRKTMAGMPELFEALLGATVK